MPEYLDAGTILRVSHVKGTPIEEVKSTLSRLSFSNPDEFGVYPIHTICSLQYDLIDFAIERGADVNVANPEGYTPLHIAISRGDLRNVTALLRNHADTEARDRHGNNALLSAVLRGPSGYKIAEDLLAAGANPDVQNINGKSARSIAEDINHPLLSRLT